MALNDNAVFTAATGYVYTGEVGTTAPTPEQLKSFNSATFGAHQHKLVLQGNPTGGTFTLSVGSGTTEDIAYNASAAAVQAALEKLTTVGAGNVVVEGTDFATSGYTVAFVGTKLGQTISITSTSTALTGGTTAKVNITELAKPNGWTPIGHTASDDLPEFGYEGGDTETKGSWQKKTLKEVTTDTLVDYVTLKLLQFDADTMELYYGKNASSIPNVFGVKSGGAKAVERAILIILQDGDFVIAFSAAKASTRRDEAIALAPDDFSQLPIRATFLDYPGRNLFDWTLPAA